jgi:diadenosine tetraphosphate (Ap4A) HIT family hydrolase
MNTAPQEKCVFCEIVAGRAPAHIVHGDDLSLCLLDIHPYAQESPQTLAQLKEPEAMKEATEWLKMESED